MSKQPEKQSVGAPVGSQNGYIHGIVAFKNRARRIARRGRSVIDLRTAAGKNAAAMREALIQERGGPDNLSVAELTMIELVARDTFYVDEIDRRIFAVLYRLRGMEKRDSKLGKIKNPKAIAILYSYRQSVTRNLSANLMALGLKKPQAKAKTLEEIFADNAEEIEQHEETKAGAEAQAQAQEETDPEKTAE
jgi:hypothetical protein